MSSTVYHKNLTPADIHIVYSFLYADESSRQMADGFSTGDVGKLARVISPDDTLYMLISHSPPRWSKVGGGVEPATDLNLGGVMIPSTGGLYVDTVGNLTLNSEFLGKISNLPGDIISSLGNVNPANGPTGADQVGFGGHSTTNLTVSSKTVENALKEVINKISQNSSDIYNMQTAGMKTATTTTLGAVKVPLTGGLVIDASGNIGMKGEFFNQLSSLGSTLDGKVDELVLSNKELGSKLVGYAGYGISGVDPFTMLPMTLEDALNTIAGQINTIKSSQTAGVGIATANELGGIRIGDGLTIDPLTGVVDVTGGTGGASSFLELTDVSATNYSGTSHYLLRVNTNANGIEFVNPEDVGIGTGGGDPIATDYNNVFMIEGNWDNDVSTWTIPDAINSVSWNIQKDGSSLRVQCPVNGIPYQWTTAYDTGTGYTYFASDVNRYMSVIDSKTVLFANLSTASNIFKIYMAYWMTDQPATASTSKEVIDIASFSSFSYSFDSSIITSVTKTNTDLTVAYSASEPPYAYSIFIRPSAGTQMYIPNGSYGLLKLGSSSLTLTRCGELGADSILINLLWR